MNIKKINIFCLPYGLCTLVFIYLFGFYTGQVLLFAISRILAGIQKFSHIKWDSSLVLFEYSGYTPD